MTKMSAKGLPQAALRQFVSQIVSGLLLQLTSAPMELLAMEWCHEKCPGLREEQEIVWVSF